MAFVLPALPAIAAVAGIAGAGVSAYGAVEAGRAAKEQAAATSSAANFSADVSFRPAPDLRSGAASRGSRAGSQRSSVSSTGSS